MEGWSTCSREWLCLYIWVAGEDREVLEHRHIMEQHLGRALMEDEEVHHKDKNRSNNSIDNLELMTKAEHRSHHARERVANGTHHFLGNRN